MGEQRVWMTDVRMEPGGENVVHKEDEGGNIVHEGTGVHDPGRITITLQTATANPHDVSVGEILDAVKRWCMTAAPDPDEGGGG